MISAQEAALSLEREAAAQAAATAESVAVEAAAAAAAAAIVAKPAEDENFLSSFLNLITGLFTSPSAPAAEGAAPGGADPAAAVPAAGAPVAAAPGQLTTSPSFVYETPPS